jgi:hypothetical protein
MAFAEAADRRVAGHRTNGRETMGNQHGLRAHPRSRRRSLAAGVAASDNDDIERVLHGRDSSAGFTSLRGAFATKQSRIESRSWIASFLLIFVSRETSVK